MTGSLDGAALVVIDMQEIFRSPESEWFVPAYDAAAAQVIRLSEGFSGPTIWTRFVRDADEPGAWRAYYERWSRSRHEPDSPAWDLTLPVAEGDEVLSLPTFSKWGPELAALTAKNDHLVVCGVATDCCVIATVLGAVDAGKRVTVVTDACAGATSEAHGQAVGLMGLLSPMVSVVEMSELTRLP